MEQGMESAIGGGAVEQGGLAQCSGVFTGDGEVQ